MALSLVCRWIVVILFAGVILFTSLNPLLEANYGVKRSDEAYYFKYANSVVLHGRPAFHDLILWYASSGKARAHPAPVRVGYMLLSASLFKLYGVSSFSMLGLISTLSFFIFLYVCFYYVRKYFDLDTALLSLLFLSSSPLMLCLSRRALIDSSSNLLWGLSVWLFLDVLLKPKRFSYACFLITFIIAVTFKEMSVILIPFFIMAGIIGRRNGALIKVSQIYGIAVYPLVFIFLFYGWIYGGVGVLETAARAILSTHFSSHHINYYAIYYCSGPWFKYFLDFLLIIPVELLLFIGYAGYLCVQRSALDFKKTYLLFYFIYVYAFLSSLPHSKVVRFVVNLEMVIALFAVLMLGELLKGLDAPKRRFIMIYACMTIFIFNWLTFMNIFYVSSMLDPISYYLLVYRQFIPWLN